MFRYIFGFSLIEKLLAPLSLRGNAHLGRLIAIAAALGWALLIRLINTAFLPSDGNRYPSRWIGSWRLPLC
jgi:hypothetical protein